MDKEHHRRPEDCIGDMLRAVYSEVYQHHRIDLGTKPEDYSGQPFHSSLSSIYSALENHRGFKDFVKRQHVIVDFFIPDPGFIVECDESQHFTLPRKVSLESYPDEKKTGYVKEQWITRCDELNKHDNDPTNRDEARAWYDTLRDFLPEIKGFLPTVRLYAGEKKWCRMDPEKSEDVEQFGKILFNRESESYVKEGELRPPEQKLENLLYAKTDLASSQLHRLLPSESTLPCWIATVTLRSEHEKDPTKNDERLREIPLIIESVLKSRSSDGIILFPGGWIHTGSKGAQTGEDAVCIAVTTALKQTSSDILVCIGIDGRMDADGFDHDQIALLIDKTGIKQRVRKFCASPQEKDIISHNLEPLTEARKSHTFSFKGKNYFIAICYDICANKPGPKGFGLTNPGVDYVLNLVHRFPKSGEGSGVWYFVRDNFGGASRDWKCPVFGTGIFIEQEITNAWRTGVSWNLGNVPTNSAGITADALSIPYETIPRIVFPKEFSDTFAEIRFFDQTGSIHSRENVSNNIPRQRRTTMKNSAPSKDAQNDPSTIIRPFIEACDRKKETIHGLEKGKFNNGNNPKQTRYYFPDWEKMDNRPNHSVFYELNDWNRYGENEVRIDIQFWNEGFQEIGEQIREKKDIIGGMMPLQPMIEWYVDTKNPQWSRLQFIFPDTTEPEIVAQCMQVLIDETKDTVNDWLISKHLRHC